MPRGAAITVENNFTKGLITEFTAMNFPENAVTEGDNVVFSELGAVTRRPGMDFEPNFVRRSVASLTPLANSYAEFEWSSVGNDGTKTFVVQQIGVYLRFFENSDTSLSASLKSFSVDLRVYKTPGTTDNQVASNPCQFTSGKGYLFVAHPFCDPIYVEYNQTSDTITPTRITIQIRDFEGVEDNLAENDTRPFTLSELHKYNLYNQGWYYDGMVFIEGTGGNPSKMNVLLGWDQSRADFPSNADIWWLYKGNTEEAYFGDIINDFHRERGLVGPAQVTLGNTPAPKGHYIYNAFNIDRTAATGIPNLPSESAGQARPSSIAFFAGRVFYAGVSQDGFSDKIYFTQIIESDTQLGRCYQINDPTSETIFDLLDTDGGLILLPTIERVISLKVVGDALIIIGTNGTFAIRGTENGPFRATDYTIDYVSTIGGVSNLSVVEVGGGLLWWNNDGLYNLTKDSVGIFFQVQNVSKQTIQSVLDSVPPVNKLYVKGAYNARTQIVQWVYSDLISDEPFTYNRILELNVASQAFYTHSLDTSLGSRVRGVISISGTQLGTFSDNVVDNLGELVTDDLGDTVTVELDVIVPNIEIFKYPTTTPIGSASNFTYSEMSQSENRDWFSQNGVGVDYSSYFLSGYRIRGEFLRSFNSTPIVILMRNLEEGQLLLSGVWDYGWRESTTQQLYLTRPEVDYLIRRIKLRGKGKSLQLKFQSFENAPFELVGWSTFDTGGQQP